MTVLVTGATGFIGAWIARALVDEGVTVRATRRAGSSLERLESYADRIEWVTADVFDPAQDLTAACAGVELCVHSAWYAVPGKYLEARENLDCVHGTLRLMEALGAAKAKRAVLVGTCFEYDFEYGLLTESTPTRPASLYAACKSGTRTVAEHLARQAGMEFCWVRPFYQYGPFEDGRRLVPYVIETLARGETAQLTSGLQVRDFLHVRDVGAAIAAAARSSLTGVVNIGSGRPVTVREIVTTIAALLDARDRVAFGARPDNPTDPPFICANVRRLREGAGFTPKYDLESGLRDTVTWWRERERVRA